MRFALVITRDASGIYELCDRYGLYMIAENNLESHGSWDAGKSRTCAEGYHRSGR